MAQNVADFLVAVACLSLAGIIALALFATFCKLFKLIVIDPIVNWVNKPRSLNKYTGSTGPGCCPTVEFRSIAKFGNKGIFP